MKKEIKIALDVLAIIASISTIIVLFFNRLYALAIVGVMFAILFGLLAYYHYRNKPMSWKEVHIYHDIKKGGSLAEIRKENLLIIHENNIQTLVDRNFSATGKLVDFKSSLGEIVETLDEGGTITTVTMLKSPLERDKLIKHVISYKAIDCYLEESETVSHIVRHKSEKCGIHIKFPSNKIPTEISGYRIINDVHEKVDELIISKDRSEVSFTLYKPKLECKMVLSWSW